MKRTTKKTALETLKKNPALFYGPMPEDWKKLLPVITLDTFEGAGLHWTTKHQGKMAGMVSLSTTCKCGTICPARIAAAGNAAEKIKADPLRDDVSICGLCFSDRQQDYQKSMTLPLARNFDILNGGIIHEDWIPTVNAVFVRGESFGDFASVNAVINFWNICRKNPLINMTAWTKNVGFFLQAVKQGYKKPDNFHLGQSSRFINRPAEVSPAAAGLVDFVFTVYTTEFAALHNITINCGARSCLGCLRCYTGFNGTAKHVNELLK